VPAETQPISAVIATRNRAAPLRRTLESLAAQEVQPSQIVVIDASEGGETRQLAAAGLAGLASKLEWFPAQEPGAASQRNEGIAVAAHDVIWFFDDDVIFEPGVVRRLHDGLSSDASLGGVNAFITNQHYAAPGRVSRILFTVLHGRGEPSFAGKVIGPGINLLPEDREDLPELVRVDWLNTTCTMYRRDALPDPPFDPFFTGYSLMEDLALSLKVRQRGWKLANVRIARIFHDSQAGEHKADAKQRAAMELINRHYIMSTVLRRTRFADHLKLLGWELFQLASLLASAQHRREFAQQLAGKTSALRTIIQDG
jgi:GT2 family glycosyltransferase